MLNNNLLAPVEQCKGKVVIAFSGGLDSTVLLHFASSHLSATKLLALHVNHQLQPDAAAMEVHCRNVAAAQGIAYKSVQVQVKTAGSVERNARDARYQAFAAELQPGDWILMAHHLDDQVETALLRLFRGDEVPGVRGMPAQRSLGHGTLLRPFLGVTRKQLAAYAHQHHLANIEDASNRDLGFDRNYLRHEVIPGIVERFDTAASAIVNGIDRDEEVREYLNDVARQALNEALNSHGHIAVPAWQTQPALVRRLMLRLWLDQADVAQPTGAALKPWINKYSKALRLRMGNVEMRTFNEQLVLTRALDDYTGDSGGPLLMPQADTQQINNVAGGRLTVSCQTPGGLKLGSNPAGWRLRLPGDKVRVRRLRSLKNLMHELGVPVWLKDRLPLIVVDDELVAIPAIPDWQVPQFVAPAFAENDGTQGLHFAFSAGDRLSLPDSA